MSFAVFAGDDFYPCGGWDDHVETLMTLDAALAVASKLECQQIDWWHIVDLDVDQIVVGAVVLRCSEGDYHPGDHWQRYEPGAPDDGDVPDDTSGAHLLLSRTFTPRGTVYDKETP